MEVCCDFALMEPAPGVSAATRNGGVSLPTMSLSSSSSSQPSRKEWRVVPEQSARNSGNEVNLLHCPFFFEYFDYQSVLKKKKRKFEEAVLL